MSSPIFRLFRHSSGIAVLSSVVMVACGGKYVEGTPEDRQVPLDELVGGSFGVGGASTAIGGGTAPIPSGGTLSANGGTPPGVGSAPSPVGGASMGAGGVVATGGSITSSGGAVGSGGLGSGGVPIFVGAASCDEPIDLGRPEFLQIEGALTPDASDRYQAPCGGQGPEAVFLYHAPLAGLYSFDTRFSTIDTLLSAVTDDCSGTAIACNDDTYELDSAISLSMTEGQTVALIVEGFSGQLGDYSLNIALSQVQGTCAVDLGSRTGTLWSGELNIQDSSALPSGECGASVPAVSFRWQAPESGLFDFSTMGSNFDTVMVFRMDCGLDWILCNDDSEQGGGTTSQIQYEMFEGQEIVIEISTYNGFVAANPSYLNFSIERE